MTMTDVATAPEEGLVQRVQELTARVEELQDLQARMLADELAAAIVQLYGEGLTRIFDALGEEGAEVTRVRERLTEDGVVASLMLIHGLYPVPLHERVAQALGEVRPYLDSHGGDVELLGIEDGVVRLKLVGHCRTCSVSSATLELVVEDALRAAAPDLAGMEVEGLAEPTHPIPNSPAALERTWVALEGADAIARGMVVTASQGLLVANVAGTLLAYQDRCAACGSALAAEGLLLGGTLTCPSCASSFDLPRAGRCRDDVTLQLTPVPLLRGAEGIRIAVAA
jgi:Fe-S cluster biogenesis protein NfuA/nitrite reductase/ring-hydroxylating ferredoxin subunit